MNLLKISEKKWKEARLFFQENPLSNNYQINDKFHFESNQENNIYACVKDFFGEFSVDFINIYLSEIGNHFVYIPDKNSEAKLAFNEIMKQENIQLIYFQNNDEKFYQLVFPPSFDWKKGDDRIKKSFSKTYQEILNMKLLHKTLFSHEFDLEKRHKIYRGILATCHPEAILKMLQDLIQACATPENVQHVVPELEKILTKVILIDRHKNTMQMLTEYLKNSNSKKLPIQVLESRQVQFFQNIIDFLAKKIRKNNNALIVLPAKLSLDDSQERTDLVTNLQEQLSMVAHQATAYNTKRQELIGKIDVAEKESTYTLDKVIKLDLTENLDLSTLYAHSDQFAFALKNRSYKNYLNILPEDFYGLAWSKNLDNPNSNGQTLKKIATDFNGVSNQVTNDVVHALGYHHQVNIFNFYIFSCKKLVEIGDFNNAYAIFSGLNHVAVGRLHYLKNHQLARPIYQQLDHLFCIMNSMKNYRVAVEEALRTGKIVVPFMGLHLKELTFAEEGNPILLSDSNLNLDRIDLLGMIYGNLDDSLALLYRLSPLKSCLSLKKLENISLDDDKVYEVSLNCLLKEIPDISECKTLQALEEKILIKRTLPLYLCISSHHDVYHMPKAYYKIIDFIENKMSKKSVSSNDLQIGLQLVNKIRLHANRNHMLTDEMLKKIDKINRIFFDKTQQITTLLSELEAASESSSPRKKYTF